VGWIVSWWILAPFIGFFVGLLIGRHFYPWLARHLRIVSTEGPLVHLERDGPLPRPELGPNTTRRELAGNVGVMATGCYMSFSAGASNVPNAVAPLVSGDAIGTDAAILIATAAIGLGAFTIARRTMESVGTELTDISLFAALIVLVTSATITTGLSWLGVPIAVTIVMVMTIAGLGWGRATRPITLEAAVRGSLRGDLDTEIELGAVTASPETPVGAIGEREPREIIEQASDLFDRRALARYVTMWIVSASLSLGLSYLFFLAVPFVE
jgi:PiT family inorganic phosphate transporter